ncbi:MAG TPA: PQQ-dependent sugar dehydrogenase [Longimicrobiales bacterium]|nr:PQQ-dependent sugar dehydrogenase [Longimicrobiales bacterium]
MIHRTFRAPVAVLAGLAVMIPAAAHAQSYRSEHHAFRAVPVAEGLNNPWSIAFVPGGDILITERAGRLRIVRNGQLLEAPVEGVPEVRARGQGGLLEVALHPQFESNRFLYLTYSKPNADGSEGTTAVARGRFENDRLIDVQDIFVAEAWSRGGNHFGSRIAFDSDGYLFVTVGDRGASPDPATVHSHPAQDLSNHQGTVNRLHDDGRIPADNPFVGRSGAQPSIWSYGHRNQQGLAYDATTGYLWENEHGPQGGDELNLVRRGGNYGWPVIGYGLQYGGSVIHQSTTSEGMEQPAHYWVPSIATSGLMIYLGDRFPAWRGSAFSGGLAGEQIARVMLNGERATGVEVLMRGVGRVRDIREGPDGFIYVALDHRGGGPTAVLRLEPVD